MRPRSCFSSLVYFIWGNPLPCSCGFPQENDYLTLFLFMRCTGSVYLVQLVVKIKFYHFCHWLLTLLDSRAVCISKRILVSSFSQCRVSYYLDTVFPLHFALDFHSCVS